MISSTLTLVTASEALHHVILNLAQLDHYGQNVRRF